MVAMRPDLDANIDDIIQKLDSIYGSVDKKEILLTQFYGARRGKSAAKLHVVKWTQGFLEDYIRMQI